MSQASLEDYREAIRADICNHCSCFVQDPMLPSGRCKLEPSGACPIFFQLPEILDSVSAVHDESIEPYVTKLRARVCANCENQNENQVCRLRDSDDPSLSWCILDTYFTILVEAVERVDRKRMISRAGARNRKPKN